MSGLPAPLKILGVGLHEPSRLVGSEEIDARLGRPPGWSHGSSGVRTRRYANLAAGETASAMGASAAVAALRSAGLEASDLSAVVGACAVMEQPIPGASVLIHRRLGLGASGIPALDVNATCLSFLAALQFAALQIGAGVWNTVLIVASDLASSALDPRDLETAPLFGDGAAAVVVGRAVEQEASSFLAWRQETYSEGAETTWLGAGGSRLPAADPEALLAEALFRMDGPAAYRVAAPRMRAFRDALLAEADVRQEKIDWIVPHQASGPALDLACRKLGFASERVVRILEERGNQVAASLPTALVAGIEDGRIRRNDHILLIGTGAGVSLGGAVLVF